MERIEDNFTNYTEEEVSTKMPEDAMIINNTDNRPISAITVNTETELTVPSSFDEDDIQVNDAREEEKMKKFEQKKENEKTFCIAVDGNEHADYAFNLLVKEFLHSNNSSNPNNSSNLLNKLLVIYVYDSSLMNQVNYKNRKDTVMNKYNTMLATSVEESQFEFIQEDKNKTNYKTSHPLDLVNRTGLKFKSNFLFCGYNSMKGPKGDNRELSKGTDFLLRESRMPTVIVKEGNLRVTKEKQVKGYKWLFAFDRANSDCHKIFDIFLPLINKKLDTVHAITLLPSFISYDDIKKSLQAQIEKEGLNKDTFVYECEEYQKNPASIIVEKINYGETHYDFVVFYNNPEKYKSYPKSTDVMTLVQKAACNICFINGGLFKLPE